MWAWLAGRPEYFISIINLNPMKRIAASSALYGILPEILKLNLDRIKWKLSEPEEGRGWSQELCDHAETEYKKYLTMVKLFPEQDIVPNRMVNKFWHQHILDTRAYAKDCNSVFGRFIHHYPYFGMYGAEDRQELVAAFERTKEIYKSLFLAEMEER